MASSSRRDVLKSALALAAGKLSYGMGIPMPPNALPAGAGISDDAFYPGALPARSDVVMSTRSFRPDALDQLKAFHATRNEWVYTNDPNWVAGIKKLVYHVGLAISPARRIPNDTGAARGVDGKIVVAPWMKAINEPWNSIFKSDTRNSILNTVKDAIAMGADSLHCDDPAMEYSITQWAGGDFSPEAVAAFRSHCQSPSAPRECRDLSNENYDMGNWVRHRTGSTENIDWKDFKQRHGAEPAWQAWTNFMKGSTQSFLGSIRQNLHSQPRPLPLSININNPIPISDYTFLLDSADYLISEIYNLRYPRQLACFHACTAAWQMQFVPSIVPVSTPDTQWAVALAYALGNNPLVPWDIYVPNKDRYYGTVSDFGYLFDFVKANASYFDGYDEISDVALVIDESSAAQETVYVPGMRSLDMGATFRLAVLRPNGTATLNRASAFGAQVAVAVNTSLSNAKALFPSIPSVELSDYKANGTHPALRRLFRTVTPDPQRIVAVPRINKRNSNLLIHVVDATNSGQGFNDAQFMDVIVPQPYWSYVKGIQDALLIRPGASPLKRTVSMKRDSETITMRVPLAGISGWGVLVFRS